MDLREHMEYLVELGDQGCASSFPCNECPFNNKGCANHSRRAALAKYWLKDPPKEDIMDKNVVIERLDSLENEAKELRKIIEGAGELTFDKANMYVAIIEGCPYILTGDFLGNHYRWHSFRDNCTIQVWSSDSTTGQAALDYVKNYDVHVFKDGKAGMAFFYDAYMKVGEWI